MLNSKEQARLQAERKRKQILKEFWGILKDSTVESAFEILRLFGYIIIAIMLLWMLTPQQ
ncbi:MAG: hypothetical protein ACYCQL_08105 [Acidithiobacillus sp.]